MNGRFVELAYQSKLFDGTGSVPFKDVEKFAQLIVRECASIAGMNDDETSSEGDIRARSIKRQIKQHFGVEE